MPRVPELDALRALAATVVLLFHLDPPRFYFGWTGVDLFFVLSGYLITTIILKHQGNRRFLYNFYVRRSLRIWPIYYLVLIGLVLANPHLPKPQPMDGLVYYLTYIQNVPSYWGRPTPPFNPAFDHSWTLALEEQFYLVWPALIGLAGRRRSARVCVGVIALALMARAGGYIRANAYPERILVARCDGFALGGLLAALVFDRERFDRDRRRFTLAFGVTTLVALGYLECGMRMTNRIGFLGLPTPSWPALTILAVGLAYFGLVGLVVCLQGRPALWPLRNPMLGYLGRISYGLYLYHYIIYWIIDDFGFNYNQPWRVNLLKLGATLVAAMASWHLIEKPILGLKRWFEYAPRNPELTPRTAGCG